MSSTSATAGYSISFLSREAVSLLDQARKYKAEMDQLAPEDQRREVYEKIIQDLLDRSKKLSNFVVTTTSQTNT
jgi:hypothetical protein